jgi:hypothetical protein
MTSNQALTAYHKVGASKATGPALAAMYGLLLKDLHGGNAGRYTDHMLTLKTDEEMTVRAKVLLTNRAAAWDVLMGV